MGSIYRVEESDGTVSSFLENYDIYYYLEDERRLLQAPVRLCYCLVNNCFAWGENLAKRIHEDSEIFTPEQNKSWKEYDRRLNALFASRESLPKCIGCKSDRMVLVEMDGEWHPHPGKKGLQYRVLSNGIGSGLSSAYYFLSRDGVRLELPEEVAWFLTDQVIARRFADGILLPPRG